MSDITRSGVSLKSTLLDQFDRLIEQSGYKNRSEAIRDLIRDRMIAEEWAFSDRETVGVFSLVYNHEQRELNRTLTNIQHRYVDIIVSSRASEMNWIWMFYQTGPCRSFRTRGVYMLSH